MRMAYELFAEHLVSIELKNMANETYAVFDTTEGRFKAKLFDAEAPNTVQYFVDLAEGKKNDRRVIGGQLVVQIRTILHIDSRLVHPDEPIGRMEARCHHL